MVGSGRQKFGGFWRSCCQERDINRTGWLPSFQSDRATIRWRARGRGNAGASYRPETRWEHKAESSPVVVKIARQQLVGRDRVEKTVNLVWSDQGAVQRAKKHLSAGRSIS